MVTILPREENGWAAAAKDFGGGLTKGYQNASDENAIRESLERLGPEAKPQDVLKALTNTRTYNPKVKQQALENYLGTSKFEELQRHAKQTEALQAARNSIATNNATNAENHRVAQRTETNRHNVASEGVSSARNEVQNDRNIIAGNRAVERATTQEKKDLEKAEEKQKQREDTQEIVNKLDLSDEEKASFGKSLTLPTAEKLLVEKLTGNKELSPIQKKKAGLYAKDYVELTKDIPKMRAHLANIEEVKRLSNSMGNAQAFANNFMYTPKGAELKSKSIALIQPLLKVLNPTGQIAVSKLHFVNDLTALQPNDTVAVREAKIKALEMYGNQALARAEEYMKFIDDFDKGLISGEQLDKKVKNFDVEQETFVDSMIDHLGGPAKEEVSKLPKPSEWKGKTLESESGARYKSNGQNWEKI